MNGTPIYVPGQNIDIEHTNLTGSSSGRTQDGKMHIDWIRRDLVKLNLNFPAMTGEEMRFMRGLMQGQEYQFTFPDGGNVRTISAYSGEFKYTFYSKVLDIYTGVQVNVIEM